MWIYSDAWLDRSDTFPAENMQAQHVPKWTIGMWGGVQKP